MSQQSGNEAPPAAPPVPGAAPSQVDATVIAQLLQQNQQLIQMMQDQQQQAPAASGGSRVVTQKPEPPLEFSGAAGAGFEMWKRRLADWQMTYYNLDPKQKAPLLMKALKGDAAALARAAVPTDKLHDADAFDRIVASLETSYGTRSSIRQFQKFRELLACHNQTDGNLEAYLRQWRVRAAAAEEEGLTLPDTIKAYLILDHASLTSQQMTQVLSTVEQMNPGQPPRTTDVETVLRGIAQSRTLRVAGTRRPRVGLAALEESAEDWDDEDGGEEEADDDEEWNENEPDPDIDGSPDFLAAVAQLRKRFRKDKKGKKGKKGDGKGGRNKGPKKDGAGADCRWKGLDVNGDPKCFALKANKKCTKKHTPEDLETCRNALTKKGLVPCFNAFDATSGNGFEPMTRALGSASLADTGAKKSVCGDRWLGRYLKRLRAKGLADKVEELPRPTGQTFQFGGGTKSAIRRVKIPFCMEVQLGDASLIQNYQAAPFGGALDAKEASREAVDKVWEYLVVSVVPGWLPLLYGYDSLVHHKLTVMPEFDAMFHRYSDGQLRKLRNAFRCKNSGVLAFELLPGDTDRALAAAAVDLYMQSNSQETKATKEIPAQDAAREARGDVFDEDPSHDAASRDLWVAWQKSGEADALEGKGAMELIATTPTMSVTTKDRAALLTSAPETVESLGCDRRTCSPRLEKSPNNHTAGSCASSGCYRGFVNKNAPVQPSKNLPPDKNFHVACDVPKNKNAEHIAFIAPIQKDEQFSNNGNETLPPPPERQPADAEFAEGSSHEKLETLDLGAAPKEAPPKSRNKRQRKPVSRSRLAHLHVLTKCTLTFSALRKLLQRANVSNIPEALDWYREIVDQCPNKCRLWEYLHRHRLPRLQLQDMPFNQEIEMDLFKLLGIWFVIVVCRGTRWVEVGRLTNKEAATVRDAVMRIWVYRHGPPQRSISDCGGEFLSVEFIKEMDVYGIFKEVTPAYASDRHGLVERFVRTFREAAERATRRRRKLTPPQLDTLVATIQCEANNETQACGTSASLRAHGRSTTPFLTLLNRDLPPAELTNTAKLAEEARAAWREAANDRAFQTLLHKQLGPQANVQPPEPGSLVYYRRPAERVDDVVYRGPAEVLATSKRMEGAYLSHGGLLVRAAWEDCLPCHPAPRTTTTHAAQPSTDSATTAEGRGPGRSPLAAIPEEELDPREDPNGDQGASIQVFPLGPGNRGGYGRTAAAPPDAAPPPAPSDPGAAPSQAPPALLPEAAPPPAPSDIFTIGEPSEPDRDADTDPPSPPRPDPPTAPPVAAEPDVPEDVDDWFEDGRDDPPDVPPDVEHHDLDAADPPGSAPVVLPDLDADVELIPEPEPHVDDEPESAAPSDGAGLPDDPPPPPGRFDAGQPDALLDREPRTALRESVANFREWLETPQAGPSLTPGDRIEVESTRSFTASGRPRRFIAEVFETLQDGRHNVRWETKPPPSQTQGFPTPDFETLDLRTATWRALRRRRHPDPAAPAEPEPGFIATENRVSSPGPQAAPTEGALTAVLAAIAALDARLEAGGGGVQPTTDRAHVPDPMQVHPDTSDRMQLSPDNSVRTNDGPGARSVLTTLLANARRVNAAPVDPASAPPTSLPLSTLEALTELETALTDDTPSLTQLERTGAAVADSLHGHLDKVMYAFLGKDILHSTSDAIALATIKELGLRWAPPKASTWETELMRRTQLLATQSSNEELEIKLVGEMLVILEHAMARLQGLETATIAAVAAQGAAPDKAAALQGAAPDKVAALDTAVYQYDESDLTAQMLMDGARHELNQYDAYNVWGSPPSTEEEVPADATVLDTKYFSKPKMKNGKLIAKGRLTPRPFNDPERFDYRNDSPAVAKATLLCMLSMILSFGWQVGKLDISGAFLQGDPLRRNIWVELPQILIKMGLVDPIRRFRKIVKGVYGLNQAPRLWFVRLCKFLCSIGFTQSLIDPCLFILVRGGAVVALLAIYVDDLLMGGKIETIEEILAALDAEFTSGNPELSTKVDCMSYTGKDLTFSRAPDGRLKEIRVDQTAYINSKLAPTIPEIDFGKRTAQEPLKPKECDTYRELQGKLAWIGNTRMDIAIDISEGASASHAPTVGDMKRNIKVAKNVAASAALSIVLAPIELAYLCLVLFADGSWANEGNRTKGGHAVFLADRRTVGSRSPAGACMLTWLCASLKRICTSTFDSETLSLLRGCDDLTALGFLVTEMRHGRLPNILERALMSGFGSREVPRPILPMFAYCDGKSVIDAIYSSRWQIKSKRRRVDLASLRESGELEHVAFSHCDTDKMVVDGLTKSDAKLRLALTQAMSGQVSFP